MYSLSYHLTVLLIQALLCTASSQHAGPLVDLGYATYKGVSLHNGLNQFLGVRYAAPPTGSNRFKLPLPPVNETGVKSANQSAPICYGVQGLAFENAPVPQSEDCLFVDVYTPANATSKKLPVMLWIQGGAFVQLFNPNYNGSGLIEASGGNVIVVTFNYRVGPYGFLASTELAKEKNLNIGLHDQRAAIGWVSKHIDKFGGDPNKITLFGTSVGGGSVLLQTLAYGGNPPPEFDVHWSAGIAAAVYVPSVYEVRDVQFQYDQLLNSTKCSNLDCLRSLSSEEFQAANIGRPFPGQKSIPLFPYGPVVDGNFFTARPSAMWTAGNFSRDKPIALGSSHTEGTLFASQANTSADISSFLKTQFPSLTSKDVSIAERQYNDTPSTIPGVTAAEAPLYFKLAKMYGDAAFSCPTLDFAGSLKKAGVPVHLFRDHIVDPVELAAGYIVPHTWEVQAVWGPEYATQYVALPNATSYYPGQSNSFIVPQVQKYWTSIARTAGDPNRLKSSTAPDWMDFGSSMRLKLQTNATAMEMVPRLEYERCAAWSRLSGKTRI